MKMPGFNAEATLYQTSGHYLTGRHAIKSVTQKTSAIHPALEEVIYVHGCRPGYTMVDGECYPEEPLTEPGLPGGGTPPSGPGEGPGEGPTGPVPVGGGPSRPPKPRQPRTARERRGLKWRAECIRSGGNLDPCCNKKTQDCRKTCESNLSTEEALKLCKNGCADSYVACSVGPE